MSYQVGDVEIGDVVTYATFGGEIRRVYVEFVDVDIKNGESGFSGYLVDSDNTKLFLNGKSLDVWGYCRQIISVEKEVANA